MASFVKTIQSDLLSRQTVAANGVVMSASVLDVSTLLSAMVFIHFGRRAETAAGAGVEIVVEASSEASGDVDWHDLAKYTTQFAACSSEVATGTNSAGQNVITVASTTGLTAGDMIYIENTTGANSEWHIIKSVVTNTSITLIENLANAQNSGAATIFDLAEMPSFQISLDSVKRIKAVARGYSFTQGYTIEIKIITCDSIG